MVSPCVDSILWQSEDMDEYNGIDEFEIRGMRLFL